MYEYKTEQPYIFTDDGQRMFLRIRDHVAACLKLSGAVTMLAAINGGGCGDSWSKMACVDRMVELGELREVLQSREPMGQDRIFTRPFTR